MVQVWGEHLGDTLLDVRWWLNAATLAATASPSIFSSRERPWRFRKKGIFVLGETEEGRGKKGNGFDGKEEVLVGICS